MVNVEFGASTKDMWVIEDVYPEEEAEKIVNAQKGKIFGVVSGIMKAFSKQKGSISITGKEKRYEPFWHVQGKSTFEYKRSTGYSFQVQPEVIGVKINGKELKTQEGKPEINFSGEDHCFEQYEKELIQSAVTGENKGLNFYLKSNKRKIKSTSELTKSGSIVPIQHRASFLVSTLVKDILKPIQADTILQKKIEISQLDLYFRPVYTFELTESDTKRTKIVEVDAVTGHVEKVNTWIKGIKDRLTTEATWFDVGTEIAGAIIPGAGVAVIGGKYLKDKRAEKKKFGKARRMQVAYAKNKK